MAQIISVTGQLPIPPFNYKTYVEDEKKYFEDIRNLLKENGYIGENIGEIIKFPIADGYALYMVASMEPVQLIHIEFGDAWVFQYAHLLTAKEVQEKIDQAKAMRNLFS